MVVERRVEIVAPAGLNADEDVAELDTGNGEAGGRGILDFGFWILDCLLISPSPHLLISPAIDDALTDGLGQGFKMSEVVGYGQRLLDLAKILALGVVGHPSGELADEVVAIGGDVGHGVACGFEGMEDFDRALGGIQPDAVGEAAIAVGVVGQHQGYAAIADRGAAQAGPLGGQVGHKLNAIGHGFVADHVGFQGFTALAGRLERHGAGDDAAIDLRQGHVHGDVAGRKAEALAGPGHSGAAAENDLKHGHIQALPEGQVGGGPVQLGHRKAGGIQQQIYAVTSLRLK